MVFLYSGFSPITDVSVIPKHEQRQTGTKDELTLWNLVNISSKSTLNVLFVFTAHLE